MYIVTADFKAVEHGCNCENGGDLCTDVFPATSIVFYPAPELLTNLHGNSNWLRESGDLAPGLAHKTSEPPEIGCMAPDGHLVNLWPSGATTRQITWAPDERP